MTQIHGHRGFRGLHPENSIKGFIEAKKLKVDAIELDLVVTKDLQLIVNHDPWLKEGQYMINKTGEVPEETVNLFEKTRDEINQYALGTKRNLNFPEQIPAAHQISSFKDVVEHVELQNVFWNIEIKSNSKWYGDYQPESKEYAALVHEFILNNNLMNDCLIQCFDSIFLNALNEFQPHYPIGLLVDNTLSISKNLDKLDFKPNYYNPKETLVDKELISQIHAEEMECLVWTVNDEQRAKELISWGVDGLITDYPNRMKSRD